jgi:dihydrodiol dehydrogenase / D-xylose 1-dehydrogenase (NADP)
MLPEDTNNRQSNAKTDSIIGTGWISTMFLRDILITRPQARAHHQVVAIGSSSIQKATSFVTNVWKDLTVSKPQLYDNYHSVYNDSNVEIVYVGTPHVLHKQNCLDAIAAGKHVLCEKPFTINERDAKEVIVAARQKGVFIMEGKLRIANMSYLSRVLSALSNNILN